MGSGWLWWYIFSSTQWSHCNSTFNQWTTLGSGWSNAVSSQLEFCSSRSDWGHNIFCSSVSRQHRCCLVSQQWHKLVISHSAQWSQLECSNLWRRKICGSVHWQHSSSIQYRWWSQLVVCYTACQRQLDWCVCRISRNLHIFCGSGFRWNQCCLFTRRWGHLVGHRSTASQCKLEWNCIRQQQVCSHQHRQRQRSIFYQRHHLDS